MSPERDKIRRRFGRRAGDGGPLRVLLTRDAAGCRSWSKKLADIEIGGQGLEAGLEGVELPCLEIQTTDDPALAEGFRQAVATARRGDWLVFTSARGVHAARDVLAEAPDLAENAGLPGHLSLAAVGPKTAARCESVFGRCELQPPAEDARGEVLAGLLAERESARALLAVAHGGRRDVDEILAAAGWRVDRFDLYDTRPARRGTGRTLEVDAVFLASPSAVEGLLARAEVDVDVPLLAIGPTTARALREAGRVCSGIAASPGLTPLVELLRTVLPGSPDTTSPKVTHQESVEIAS